MEVKSFRAFRERISSLLTSKSPLLLRWATSLALSHTYLPYCSASLLVLQHFAVYNMESGRMTANYNVSAYDLANTFLPGFKEATSKGTHWALVVVGVDAAREAF